MIVARIRLKDGTVISMTHRWTWRGVPSNWYASRIRGVGAVADLPTTVTRADYVQRVAEALAAEVLEVVPDFNPKISHRIY